LALLYFLSFLSFGMSSYITVKGDDPAKLEEAREAFGYAKKCLIAVASTWPDRVLRTQTRVVWLNQFYHTWVGSGRSCVAFANSFFQSHLEMMARFAEVTDLGEDVYAIRDDIEEKALPHASVDWILKFPTLVAADRDRLIRYFGVLAGAYASALALGPPPLGRPCPAFEFINADFRVQFEAGVISREDFEWFKWKSARSERDFNDERELNIIEGAKLSP
jgi:hypothetical protein